MRKMQKKNRKESERERKHFWYKRRWNGVSVLYESVLRKDNMENNMDTQLALNKTDLEQLIQYEQEIKNDIKYVV